MNENATATSPLFGATSIATPSANGNANATSLLFNTTSVGTQIVSNTSGPLSMTSLEMIAKNVGESPGYALELFKTFGVLYTLFYVAVVAYIIRKTNWKVSLDYVNSDRKAEKKSPCIS